VNAIEKQPDDTKLQKACTALTHAEEDLIPNAPMNARYAQYHAEVATNEADATANNLKSFNGYATKVSDDLSKLPPIDPPISSIGQSVQFILNYGGNVSPTWTFVRFHGPNSPLFASAGTRTHMLNITLGPTVPGSFSAPSPSVTQNQLYLLLNNLLPPPVR
jgi:hypothetical protein